MNNFLSNRQAVSLYFLINGFLFANWAARLPQLQEIHGLDHQGISYVLLAHSIGAFVAMPLTGWLISRYSSRRVTQLAGFLFPLWFMLIPFVSGFHMLLIPFVLMGMSAGVMDIAMNAQAVEVEKDLGKPIMTNFHAMFSIGMVLGGLSAGRFVVIEADLWIHFIAMGLVGLLALVLASRYLYKDKLQELDDQPLFMLPKGILIGLGVIAFCCMMGEGAMADWSTNYMKKVVHADLKLQTFGLTAFASLMTVGRLIGDSGRSKLGDIRILLISAALSISGMCLILSLLSPIAVIAGFGLVGDLCLAHR